MHPLAPKLRPVVFSALAVIMGCISSGALADAEQAGAVYAKLMRRMAADTDFVRLAGNQRLDVFMLKKISRRNDTVHAVAVWVYRQEQRQPDGLMYAGSVIRIRGDCRLRTMEYLAASHFSRDETIVAESKVSADAKVIPSSINDLMLTHACAAESKEDNEPPGAAEDAPGSKRAPEARAASGSGFAVDQAGHILTNHHVVDSCGSVTVLLPDGSTHPATVVGQDRHNDMALVRVPVPLRKVAQFRAGDPRAGESVTVIGFPLSALLASQPNISSGIVSATAGMDNNTSHLQISAPVNVGNSGGPVLDQAGRLVGVVVAKLNAVNVARGTGDVPQNINFAIKATTAASFLSSHGVAVATATSTKALDGPGVADAGRSVVVQVLCNAHARPAPIK